MSDIQMCNKCLEEKTDYSTISMVYILTEHNTYRRIEDTCYCDLHGLLIDGNPITHDKRLERNE